MLFRLIGKLYFYLVILPFVVSVLKGVNKTLTSYSYHKLEDPTWDLKKQRAHDAELRNRRTARRAA
jgi:hypothetical protein